MKLRAKIKNKYLKEILEGRKKEDYRQIESIIFVDEQGNEYEFEVYNIGIMCSGIGWLRKNYPDIEWKDGLTTISIQLGKRIEQEEIK